LAKIDVIGYSATIKGTAIDWEQLNSKNWKGLLDSEMS